MNKTSTISIDLAKTVFQVAIINQYGKLSSNRQMTKKQMLKTIMQHPGATICMEACSTAHYWGRYFQDRGHTVQLVPAQIAKRYCSGNKNDKNDAVAIFEASQRSDIHFVSVKTTEQQDISTLLKLRQGYIKQRTAISLRIRGFAAEYGLSFPKGMNKLRSRLVLELESVDNELTTTARFVLHELLSQLIDLDEPIKRVEVQLLSLVKNIPPCQLLTSLRGVGWIVAAGLFAKLGDASAFRCGRDASASVGVVPAHTGSGGKNKLYGITKNGDRDLRSLVIHGARAVVINIKDKQDPLSCWIRRLLERKHFNNVVVAVANKTIRMACAMLKSNTPYQEQLSA